METFHQPCCKSLLLQQLVSTLPIRNGNTSSFKVLTIYGVFCKYLIYKEWKRNRKRAATRQAPKSVSTLPIRNGNPPIIAASAFASAAVSTLPIRNGNSYDLVPSGQWVYPEVSTLPIRNGN